MQLSKFTKDLFEQGNVTVASHIVPFDHDDLQDTLVILEQEFENRKPEAPGETPCFSSEAALWAAQYFYRAVQFIMLRDQDEEAIEIHLRSFTGEITPESVWSADLTLHYLSPLTHLAKGLAPDDVLLKHLNEVASQWPLSSVGMTLTIPFDDSVVLRHSSLRYAYIDRIIKAKDSKRIHDKELLDLLNEALGSYSDLLWPELKYQNNILFTNGNDVGAATSSG